MSAPDQNSTPQQSSSPSSPPPLGSSPSATSAPGWLLAVSAVLSSLLCLVVALGLFSVAILNWGVMDKTERLVLLGAGCLFALIVDPRKLTSVASAGARVVRAWKGGKSDET